MTIQPSIHMLKLLCSYQMNLYESAVRSDSVQLAKLLHEHFLEIRRSGQRYNKQQTLQYLAEVQRHPVVWMQDVSLIMPAYSIGMLVYRSALIEADGSLASHTERSSIWQLSEAGWQMRFHQATPCAPFVKSLSAQTASEALLN